jgi:hypothetical protein
MDMAFLKEEWLREERRPFSGWDFSVLRGRMFEDPLPWSYAERAGALMSRAKSALDMGTGGGERLLELRPCWPARTAACEDYAPNLKISSERLEPLGVEVKFARLTRTEAMPYADGEFELLLNRHSAFNCDEVYRILTGGGTFFTQQVDGHWAEDLEAIFGARPQWPDATLQDNRPLLEAAGLEVADARSFAGHISFSDVGAVVYYLRAVPWLVPGFGVESHFEGLLQLQARLERGEGLSFQGGYYLVEARKP